MGCISFGFIRLLMSIHNLGQCFVHTNVSTAVHCVWIQMLGRHLLEWFKNFSTEEFITTKAMLPLKEKEEKCDVKFAQGIH